MKEKIKKIVLNIIFYVTLYVCIVLILDEFSGYFTDEAFFYAIPFWTVLVFIIEFLKKRITK